MPTARSGLASATVNGIVYAIGGADTAASSTNPHLSTVEAYAPATNTWSTKAALPTARSGLAATAVNGIIYAIGGDNAIAASASANVFNPLTTVEAYDPIGNTWTTKAPMPTARERFAIAAVNGVIYVFGGLVPDASFVKSTTSVEAYDIGTNSWSAKAPLTTARESLSSAAVGGIVYVMGGRADAVPSDLALVEAYDPVANAWTTKAPMTVIRGGSSSVSLGGSIYAVAWNYGYTTVEAYDSTANSWTAKPALRVGFSPRDWFSATAAGNAIYALGGADSFGPLATVEAITPNRAESAAHQNCVMNFHASGAFQLVD